MSELVSIRKYIGQFSPLAAQKMSLRLQSAGNGLADFPNRGRPISRGRRELTTGPPYIVRYRVRGEVVEIPTVRHGARRPLA